MSMREVPGRLRRLSTHFERYLLAFDRNLPFADEQLAIHQCVIRARQNFGNVQNAISDSDFLENLWELLREWGMNSRGAKLVSLKSFIRNIRSREREICALEGFTISQPPDVIMREVIPRAIALLESLNINLNKARVVAGTKTLHHLLPKLIPPMDRNYTGMFFAWPPPYFQYRQREILSEALIKFNRLAQTCTPERFVGTGWRTSATKILDNAVVGFCIQENVSRPA